MANSAYLDRLTQLHDNKMESQAKAFGLPINRPLSQSAPGMSGNPMPQEPQEPMPDMNNVFGKTFEQLGGEDARFGTAMDDFKKLALGLREQVNAGYMPEPIARQKIQQYVNDSANWFNKNPATPMDNPEVQQMIEGLAKNMYEKEQQAPQGDQVEPMQGAMMPQGGQ